MPKYCLYKSSQKSRPSGNELSKPRDANLQTILGVRSWYRLYSPNMSV